jgi:hypothetical protein
MKVYHAMHEDSPDISKEDKEKMSILKLVDTGVYVKNVGIKDGQFYVLAENDTDEVYLEYKQAIARITLEMPKLIDQRLFEQKTMEFHNKKAEVVKRLMEMPR